MSILIYVVSALVTVAVLVIAIGASLPRDHVAAVAARIAAPPDAVWATLTDPAAFPTWRGDVQRVELLPTASGAGAWREHGRHGPIAYAVDVADAPSRLVTRITDDGLPFGGSWEWRIAPDGDAASHVTIIERGHVHNPLFRFVSRFLMGQHATMIAQLRALARHFGAEAVAAPMDLTPGGSHGP